MSSNTTSTTASKTKPDSNSPHNNTCINSFDTLSELQVNETQYQIHSLATFSKKFSLEKMPFCMKIILENLLRHEDGVNVTAKDIENIAKHFSSDWDSQDVPEQQIAFSPARVVLQDFTGVPALVDLAAMRDAVVKLGGDPQKINPLVPVDLVIDHSVMVDFFATTDALEKNTKLEFERNLERYNFLRWGQNAFSNFRVVPPGTGIVHQVNLEYLASVVVSNESGAGPAFAYPDTLVGTDSHTTMINGLGVVGWGVGGIEAEAAMLGQPITMLMPEVVGFELKGRLPAGATATDLVLRVTNMLRELGVVGKFVEFYGEGLASLSLADRATISNMAPEYGATIGIFPIDQKSIDYLRLTGRSDQQVALVEAYTKAQGLWADPEAPKANYHESISLDLSSVEPSIAGPKRPQDLIPLSKAKQEFASFLQQNQNRTQLIAPASAEADFDAEGGNTDVEQIKPVHTREVLVQKDGLEFALQDGAVVIAAITSCTNTSNPAVMLAAGLLAKKARARGLTSKPWVKTSLAPGSQVVPAYLKGAGLDQPLQELGFHLVGFGCTTCIGNSGPLPPQIASAIQEKDLYVASVLSGNRNFEGRIHADIKANFLASPPLVVAYALAGTMNIDVLNEPLANDIEGEPVYLKDIWPSAEEVNALIGNVVNAELFKQKYADVFEGTDQWKKLPVPADTNYTWPDSTYIKHPPFFADIASPIEVEKTLEASRCLVKVGDSITTDHISPAGAIHPESPAGKYLLAAGVEQKDFNSLGSRRGNHEVMMRGTFANVRLRNELAPGRTGGFTKYLPSDKETSVYDAAMLYQEDSTPLVVIAGKEYGTGSSRDWAAKGTNLLGVVAVVAESFERIHRSNLVGFGVLPLQFVEGESAESLSLTGEETFTFDGALALGKQTIDVTATSPDGKVTTFSARIRIDTETEWDYYLNGGILHSVLRKIASDSAGA